MRAKAKRLLRPSEIVWTMARTRRKQKAESISPLNGFILYGVDQYLLEREMKQLVYGLLEFNHIWNENEKQREYLFLGESNISWYVYQYKNQCYMELDQLSGREIHRFRNFYEMFNKVLNEAIKE